MKTGPEFRPITSTVHLELFVTIDLFANFYHRTIAGVARECLG